MCQAFTSQGIDTKFIGAINADIGKIDRKSIFKYYAVKPLFDINLFRNIKTYNNWLLNKISIIDYWWSIKRYLKNNRPDLVYGRYLPGCYTSCLLGIPTIYESHAKVWELKAEKYLFSKLILNPNLLKIVVISNALKNMFCEQYNINENKFIVAHDCADPFPDKSTITPWLGRSECLQVGYTGSALPGRGISIIVKIAKKMEDVDFHIVGADQQSIETLTNQKLPMNLIGHGRVPHAKVYKYLNQFDILLAPYQREVQVFGGGGNTVDFMSPLKIFEYMASGKVIVASDLEVLHEILDEKEAIFVQSDDIDSWIAAIEKLKNSELRTQLGTNAFIKFESNYTWKQRAKYVITNSL
jgi:glycosyltransferase involved in cell wall biosynthesis